ncbi:unnamed protein product [Rotaria sp. Silwood2]|nr:unnamed protein product [Rotaria sp. Silwood2]
MEQKRICLNVIQVSTPIPSVEPNSTSLTSTVMEDRFQFEDFDSPQLLATNNRDQQITFVAANDKIKRTKNEQQVIKENNLRQSNQ